MPRNNPALLEDPQDSAKAAGLRYVTDARPGIRRVRSGKGFRYVSPEGKAVRDKATLLRIRSLVIPPAWTDVWISTVSNGHLQATGRDARKRKQSRYHPRWRTVRDETKYERMLLFAQALPHIRTKVRHDLDLAGMPREKVLATVVRLMENTLIRVGNEEYAQSNKTYGLTTMRNKHVTVRGETVKFSFKGKSGVHHTVDVHDRRIARIVKRCEEIPGYELFQYLDEEGQAHSIDSSDINEYLQQVTGEHFTAKDFRTWAGSVLACTALNGLGPFESTTQAKKNVVAAVAEVAKKLGNTPSVCRKCYVHPIVLEAYLDGKTVKAARKRVNREIAQHMSALHREEQALLRLISARKLLA